MKEEGRYVNTQGMFIYPGGSFALLCLCSSLSFRAEQRSGELVCPGLGKRYVYGRQHLTGNPHPHSYLYAPRDFNKERMGAIAGTLLSLHDQIGNRLSYAIDAKLESERVSNSKLAV